MLMDSLSVEPVDVNFQTRKLRILVVSKRIAKRCPVRRCAKESPSIIRIKSHCREPENHIFSIHFMLFSCMHEWSCMGSCVLFPPVDTPCFLSPALLFLEKRLSRMKENDTAMNT